MRNVDEESPRGSASARVDEVSRVKSWSAYLMQEVLKKYRPPPAWHRAWLEFVDTVRDQLEAGAQEYGDRSFIRPPDELVGEIEAELADLCGWAFVLWCRVKNLQLSPPGSEDGEAEE